MRIVVTIVFLLFTFSLIAQDKPADYNFSVKVESAPCFFMVNDSSSIINGNYEALYFPLYDIAFGPENQRIYPEKEYIECSFFIDKELLTKTDKLFFDIDFFAVNVKSLKIEICNNKGEQIALTTHPTHRGYKYNPTIRAEFEAEIFKHQNSEKYSIKIMPVSSKQDTQFYIGRLSGLTKVTTTVELDGSFSNRAFDLIIPQKEKMPNTSSVLFDPYNDDPIMWRQPYIASLNINTPQSSKDSVKIVAGFIENMISQYEFQKEKNIEIEKVIKANRRSARKSKDLTTYYTCLDKLLKSFNNCHYRLSKNYRDKYDDHSPIYFFAAENEYIVSAIFDTTLLNISLGDKLVAINDISINQLEDFFAKEVYANSIGHAQAKIAQQLFGLARQHFDSYLLTLTLKDSSSNEYSITIGEDQNTTIIPPGFKILPSFHLEKIQDVAFLRVAFDQKYLIPFIYSKKNELLSSNGLILDFRGNSGGDMSFCNLLSYLIDKPTPLLQVPALGLGIERNNSESYATSIVKPSVDYYYDKPIVILVDHRTTCAAELFIKAIKQRRNDVYLVGYQASTGSAQLLQRIHLPGNVTLNYFTNKTKDCTNNVLDITGGIEPDIWVKMNSYNDLAPYNDKLKQYAIKFLAEYANNN